MIADVDDLRIGLRARAGAVGRTVTSSHTGVRQRSRNVPGGLGEGEKVCGEAVLRAENLHANEATIFEVEDDLRKVVSAIDQYGDRDASSR